MILKKLVIAMAAVLLPAAVFASGFAINEQGTKAVSMGGAFVAQADDASAVYFNPAGITQLEGDNITFGVAPITPMAEFKNSDGKTYSAKKETFIIPSLFYTKKVSDKYSLGIGLFSNFGLATSWKSDFPGRNLIGAKKAYIETVSVNPVFAYEVTDKLSLAAGPVFQKVEADIRSWFNYGGAFPGAELQLRGLKDNSMGYNLAAHYKATEKLRFGYSYRSSIKHTLRGDAETQGFTPFNAASTAVYNAYNHQIKVDLELPAIMYFGVAYDVSKWTFEVDAQWTEWSTYNELKAPTLGVGGTTKPKDWENAWTYRFGAQYEINDTYDLRFGIVRDMSPIPGKTIDPMLPSGDRWLYSAGIGAEYGNFTVDLGYTYLDDEGGKFNNPAGEDALTSQHITGEFQDVYAHIWSINVSYNF